MSRFIVSAHNPSQPAQESELRQLFGVTDSRWPDQGCPARYIQGILVHVLPKDHASRYHESPTLGTVRRSTHRCIALCPGCGAQVSVGRLARHRCAAGADNEERLRRLEWQQTTDRANAKAALRTLAIAAFAAPEETQEQDDAVNTFCEAAGKLMTVEQRSQWDMWCLKATTHEVINEALIILGMDPEAGWVEERDRV